MVDFYYVSASGEKIDLHSRGIRASETDLRNYSWEYSLHKKSISDIKLKALSRSFKAVFYRYEGRSAIDIRHEVYEIFDEDVRHGKTGRLYVGDYYLDCYVIGAGSNNVAITDHFIKTTFNVLSADGAWKRENTLRFYAVEQSISDDGMDYPYDYPYDYTGVASNATTIENRSFAPSDFVLTFFGEAENPAVIIGGHTYALTGSISEGESVVIDSSAQTIRLYAPDRSYISWFNNRYKQESIFEKIPSGVSSLSWNGMCPFDLTIIEERSEPPFGALESDVPEYALALANYDIVLTSEGDYIVLS